MPSWRSHCPLPRRNTPSHPAKTLQRAADRKGQSWSRLMPPVLWPWAKITEGQISSKMESAGVCYSAQGMKGWSATLSLRRHFNLKWCCSTFPCLAHRPPFQGSGRSTENKTGCSLLQSSVTVQGTSARSQQCPPDTLSLALFSSSPCCTASGATLSSWGALPLGSLIPFCHPVSSITQRFSFFQRKSSISLVLCFISDPLKCTFLHFLCLWSFN